MPLQEACVLTLCRLAKLVNAPEPTVPQLNKSPHRVSDEEEKNIILLRLVEYLGHTNPYVCAVAYNEVRDIQAKLFILLLVYVSSRMRCQNLSFRRWKANKAV